MYHQWGNRLKWRVAWRGKAWPVKDPAMLKGGKLTWFKAIFVSACQADRSRQPVELLLIIVRAWKRAFLDVGEMLKHGRQLRTQGRCFGVAIATG